MRQVEELDQRAVEIGRRVRALREAKRWSRRRLAGTINMTENTVYRIEVGRVLPTLETLDRIGRAYGLADGRVFYPRPDPADELIVAGIVRVA